MARRMDRFLVTAAQLGDFANYLHNEVWLALSQGRLPIDLLRQKIAEAFEEAEGLDVHLHTARQLTRVWRGNLEGQAKAWVEIIRVSPDEDQESDRRELELILDDRSMSGERDQILALLEQDTTTKVLSFAQAMDAECKAERTSGRERMQLRLDAMRGFAAAGDEQRARAQLKGLQFPSWFAHAHIILYKYFQKEDDLTKAERNIFGKGMMGTEELVYWASVLICTCAQVDQIDQALRLLGRYPNAHRPALGLIKAYCAIYAAKQRIAQT
jgi:hypothetical protein